MKASLKLNLSNIQEFYLRESSSKGFGNAPGSYHDHKFTKSQRNPNIIQSPLKTAGGAFKHSERKNGCNQTTLIKPSFIGSLQSVRPSTRQPLTTQLLDQMSSTNKTERLRYTKLSE